MEIERKYLIGCPPENLNSYPSHKIEQGYLCTQPVVRIRRQEQSAGRRACCRRIGTSRLHPGYIRRNKDTFSCLR